jgi:hypothetical protein
MILPKKWAKSNIDFSLYASGSKALLVWDQPAGGAFLQ